MTAPWCVAWRHPKTGTTEWCATYRGARPTEDAKHDRTRCRAVVTLRIGSQRRQPTCPECRRRVRAAKERRS